MSKRRGPLTMMGWVVAFMILLTIVSAAAIICIALIRPKQHDHASKIKGYTLIECTYQVLSDPPTNRKNVTKTHEIHALESNLNGQIKSITSKNWSGYVVSDNLTNPKKFSVQSVSGEWSVPRLLAKKPLSSPRYSAIWVGLDGYHSKNATVQQIGTESDWDPTSGQQLNYAWFQVHDKPPVMIVNFPLSIGDSISGAVKLINKISGQFQMTLRNNTKGVAVVIPSTFTISPHAQCTSAEFVMEAPFQKTILPLADFGAQTFHECICTVNDILGPINGKKREFAPINMVIDADQPILTKTIATTSPLTPNGKSFAITFV